MADAVTPTPDAGTPEVPGTPTPEADLPTTEASDQPDAGAQAETKDDAEVTTPEPEAPAPEVTGESKEPPAEDADGDDSDDDADDDAADLDPKARKAMAKARREASNLRSRLRESEAETKAANLRATRLEVAMASGIPADALEFIQGDDQEAMEASAEKLLVMMGYTDRVTPPGGPVEQGGNPRRGDFTPVDQARQNTDLDSIGARIYQR